MTKQEKQIQAAYQKLIHSLKADCEKVLIENPVEADAHYANRFTKVKPSDIKCFKDRCMALMTLTSNQFSWCEELHPNLRKMYAYISQSLLTDLYDNAEDVAIIHRFLD